MHPYTHKTYGCARIFVDDGFYSERELEALLAQVRAFTVRTHEQQEIAMREVPPIPLLPLMRRPAS